MSRVFVDVDVQRDFCEEGGALCVKGAPNAAFRALTAHATAQQIPILGSVDSHAYDAWEFASSGLAGPEGERPGFPDHCVKGTAGWLKVDGTLPPRSRFIPNVAGPSLTLPLSALVAELVAGRTQALYFEKEVYSLFANPIAEPLVAALAARLRAAGEEPHFIVYGVATDYCVKAAATELARRGYRTTVLTDAIAGITPEGEREALEELRRAGVGEATTAEILSAR